MGVTFFLDIGNILISGISLENFAYLAIFCVFAHLGWIIKYLWQPISTPEYVINSKVKVVLKSTDQGLSISGLISLLKWCLVWWNFIWKLLIFFKICGVFAHPNRIIKYLWQSIYTPEFVINSKVKIVLKSTDQGLSILGLISLLKWCLVWWNSIWKLLFFSIFLMFSRILAES